MTLREWALKEQINIIEFDFLNVSKCVEVEAGMCFEKKNTLYFWERDTEKVYFISEQVREWIILEESREVIFNKLNEGYESNHMFWLSDFYGRQIIQGYFSPVGQLVYRVGNCIESRKRLEKPVQLIRLGEAEKEVEFLKQYICVEEMSERTPIPYYRFYDYEGNLCEMETRRDRIYGLMSWICFSFVDFRCYEEKIRNRNRPKNNYDYLNFLDDVQLDAEINFNNIDKMICKLNVEKIIDKKEESKYLKLKQMLEIDGERNIERKVINIMEISQGGDFTKKNTKFITQKILCLLSKLKKQQTQEQFYSSLEDKKELWQALKNVEREGGDEK